MSKELLYFSQVRTPCKDAGLDSLCRHRGSTNEGCTVVKGDGTGFTNIVLQGHCAKSTNWSEECQSIDYLFFNNKTEPSDGWEREPAFGLRAYKNSKGLNDWKQEGEIGLESFSGQDGKLYHALCFAHNPTTTTTTTSTTTTTKTSAKASAETEMSSDEMRSALNKRECISSNTTMSPNVNSDTEEEKESFLPHIDLFLNPNRFFF